MPGKTESQKQKLADQVTQTVVKTLHDGQESVSVALLEVGPSEWAEKVYRTDIVGNEQNLYKKPGYSM